MPLLSALLAQAGVEPDRVSGDALVTGLCEDTRRLEEGQCFVAMPSSTGDSHRFLSVAKSAGAAAALVHSETGFEAAVALEMPAVLVREEDGHFVRALWRLAKVAFGNPSAKLQAVGVTGTNGKTTTAWLIRDAMQALGRRAAYLGTLGIQTPRESRELANTTPFAVETQRLIAECVSHGAEVLAMEVSSHALKEFRADGVEFDAAVFTNLTQDHLDYHGDMRDYAAAKLRLFTELPAQSEKRFTAAINMDDETGRLFLASITTPVVTYGINDGELRGQASEVRVDGLRMTFRYRGEEALLTSRLGGMFNVQNCLSACAGLIALGLSLEDAAKGLTSARPVPGRFEAIPNSSGIGVIVDYAHTPDALQKLLMSVRALRPRRVLTVFGCGGDRDRSKRPKMAAVVSELSDVTIVTSDNPRTEDPEAILREIEAGLKPGAESLSIIDRREAVAAAIRRALPGDVVVIAGKGHENYQIIGRTKVPMDDRELAKEALSQLGNVR